MSVTADDLFAVMASASIGERGHRVVLDDDVDHGASMTRLAIALNILLDDLDYRYDQSRRYMDELLAERTQRLHEAETAVRQREEFISVAGHELNTPLMSLSLTLEGLRRGMIGKSAEQLERVVALAERQVRKLALLVDTLLGVGRTRSGGTLRLDLTEVDAVALAYEIGELLANDLARAGCTLTVEASGPVVGRWDRQRLSQVMLNTVSNAIKFGAGKPISITIEAADEMARFTITDHGIGIAADDLSRIFELFERAVPTANYGGLGIGLFIVREIVLAHGGRVRAESAPGQGASIIVELPLGGPRDVTSASQRLKGATR